MYQIEICLKKREYFMLKDSKKNLIKSAVTTFLKQVFYALLVTLIEIPLVIISQLPLSFLVRVFLCMLNSALFIKLISCVIDPLNDLYSVSIMVIFITVPLAFWSLLKYNFVLLGLLTTLFFLVYFLFSLEDN